MHLSYCYRNKIRFKTKQNKKNPENKMIEILNTLKSKYECSDVQTKFTSTAALLFPGYAAMEVSTYF